MDDGVDNATCADGVNNHSHDEPDSGLQHDFANVSDDDNNYSEDCKESQVLEENSREWESDLDVTTETLVEKLKNLGRI